ncbi:MAG: sulfatase-like hydrolase/transferase [Candidatus Brocadiaceae bacterium]
MTEQRASVIIVQTDSQDGRAMGCMGHPAMQGVTPNMDMLAERGVVFLNTYCNNPICCPSRASMFSGRFTHHCEGWNNYKGLEPGDSTFLERFEDAGYRVKTLGKTDYVSGHHTVRARVTPWTRAADIRRPEYRMPAPEVMDDERERVAEHDWRNVDGAVEWLTEHASDHEPFLLYLGLNQPHPRFRTSRRYLDRIDPDAVRLPPPDESSHPVMELMRLKKNWMHGLDEETVRLVRRIYFGMIAEVDAMLGRVLEAVGRTGLAGSSYVFFTSDHGEMNMEHDQFYKMCHYEPSARVPLIVSGPGVAGGHRVETLTSLIHIHPTLTDIAGLPRAEGLDGQSLLPELGGDSPARPDRAFAEFHGTTSRTGAFMLRLGGWKYVAHPGFAPQLFDLEEDPWEVRDLAESRPEVVANMDSALRDIVDYEGVDARVKEYDRQSFRHWRQGQIDAGTYRRTMARIFSGWDGVDAAEADPWTEEDEGRIRAWLEGAEPA